MAPRLRKQCAAPEEEVKRRWTALHTAQRKALLHFDDAGLVERIWAGLQELFSQHTMMQQLGICIGGDADPFASSRILKKAFEFTWQMARSVNNPSVVRVEAQQHPVMEVKEAFLEREEFLHELRSTLPDFLSLNSGRVPLPRPRWKELWANEPASIQAMEKQLVKLIEQALWAMAADPAYAVALEADRRPMEESMEGDCIAFEPWMEECDAAANKSKGEAKASATAKKKKKRKAKKGNETSSATQIVVEEEEDDDDREHIMIPTTNRYCQEESINGDDDKDHPSLQTTGTGVILSESFSGALEELGDPDRSQAVSDDESVGLGTFYLADSITDVATVVSTSATTATLSSTPAGSDRLGSKACRSPDSHDRYRYDGNDLTPGAFNGGPAWLGFDPGVSTPSQSRRWPVTPPASPNGRYREVHPPSLVCYVWNQASLLSQNHSSDVPTGGDTPAGGSTGGDTPMLRSISGTPFGDGLETPFSRRGQWISCRGGTPQSSTPVFSAVVRKTFVELEEASTTEEKRTRSLSPRW